MNKKYLCGLDIGTTGAKTMIFDLKGSCVGSAYREYGCVFPKPNWVEQDIENVMELSFETCYEAVKNSGVNPQDIGSIALSTQRTTSIFLDKDEKVLKTISWQDNRSGEEIKDIEKRITAKDYYAKTGLPLNTTWIISKILWMQKNEMDCWAKVKRVVQLQDFALRKLGAEDYYIDYPDACLFGCFDNKNMRWDEELMGLAGISPELLPLPTPCATKVGEINSSVAKKTGFAEGTSICVGAGDQNSAAVGAGIIHEGLVSVSLGTGGMAIAALSHEYRDPLGKACITSHAIKGVYQFEGYQTGAASVFRWFKDEIALCGKKDSVELGSNIYQTLDKMVELTPPGAKGLVMLPYLASSAAPRWNSNARGVLLGLTFAHDSGCLARAHMEGITFEQKDILGNMIQNGITMKSVRIMGGATKSEVWNQMQADMYKMPCETLKITDSAVLGAAIFAGVAVGAFSDIKQGVSEMVTVDRCYFPREHVSKIYDELYEIYVKTYEALDENKVFDMLAKSQKQY